MDPRQAGLPCSSSTCTQFSGSLSLLHFIGKAFSFTCKPLPRRSGFHSKYTTINFEVVHIILLIYLSQHIIMKTSFYLGGISCYGYLLRLTESVFSQLDFWKLLSENDRGVPPIGISSIYCHHWGNKGTEKILWVEF